MYREHAKADEAKSILFPEFGFFQHSQQAPATEALNMFKWILLNTSKQTMEAARK